ncbi:MAG: hypothetical protein KBT36_15745 [Kurthia sp.]|nr:hypothetical protein [Candidatus Kurthia equi]
MTSLVILSFVAIFVGSTLHPSSNKTKGEMITSVQVAKLLDAEKESTFRKYLKEEKIVTVPKGKVKISNVNDRGQVNYYVHESSRVGQEIQIRMYVLPVLRNGYELAELKNPQQVEVKKQNQLVLTINEIHEIKDTVTIFDTQFNRAYMDMNLDGDIEDTRFYYFTVIDVPKDVKVFYDVSETLRRELYNERLSSEKGSYIQK